MNSEDSKNIWSSQTITKKKRLKTDWRRKDKYIALSNLSIYFTWKNIKKSYKNHKFEISASTWNEEFELPDGSYSISDIQDYFEYIFKRKHGGGNSWSFNKNRICNINKIKNRITLKSWIEQNYVTTESCFNQIKRGYYLELLTLERMKILGSTECKK